jgi:Ca2+-binding EF-hand superfamily protein
MSSLAVQGMQSKPDPAEKFKELDTDRNGSLDKIELSAMAMELSKMTGTTLNVDNSITTYDADNDGLLNQDEMGSMMRETLGPPPSSDSNFEMQQALEAYQANSDEEEDQLSILLNMLGQSSNSSSLSSSRPNPEERFAELDSDGNGSLNQSELEVMAENLSSMTDQTMDTEEAISTYDADGDGELNKAEMNTMMKESTGKPGGSQIA